MVTKNSTSVKVGSVVKARRGTKTYNYLSRRHRLTRDGFYVENVNTKEGTLTITLSGNETRNFPVTNFTTV